jgi:cobalt-zinc-cadmium efflux system outer membrane protein
MFLSPPPPTIQAPPAPGLESLSLEEALARFRSRGLDLLLAEAAVDQAAGDRRAAGALPPSQLSLTTGRSQGYAALLPGQSDRSYGATLADGGALGDLLSGRRNLRVRAVDAALAAARLGREDALRTVGAQVKTQFLQLALARLNLDLSAEARDGAKRTLELVRTRFSAGAVSEVEVSRAEVASLETEQTLESTRQALETARAGLAFLLGERGPVPPYEAKGSFDHPALPPALAGATPASLLDTARARPDLAAARLQEERTRAALRLAQRAWVPDTGWSLGVSQQGTGQDALQPRTWTLGLSVTLPSPAKVLGETSRARADLQAQHLLLGKSEAQAAQDIATQWAAFQGARNRLTRMEDRLLDQAKRTYGLVTFQYERGAASLLDVLDAQRTWVTVKGEYLQNLNDYWTGLFLLEQAVGRELK